MVTWFLLLTTLAGFVALPHQTGGADQEDVAPGETRRDASTARLVEDVRRFGWLVFSAPSERGDWDLFACRPDGSDRRNLTRTPESNEVGAQFSRDGRRLLFRRLLVAETIDGNHYGTQGELVLAAADGSSPTVLGEVGQFPWASWSPDGKQVACLSVKGISLVDVATRQVVQKIPRLGFFQQVTWSPDGRWLSGVSNSFGESWSVAILEIATGKAHAVSGADCCTPDWFPDSSRLVFSQRPTAQAEQDGTGWTQLWMADSEGRNRRLVYGEEGRHVYGGQVSPNGKFVVFTDNVQAVADPRHAGAAMRLLRLADAPIIGGLSPELLKQHPEAKRGPVLELPTGWEPCWTAAEIDHTSTSAP
jgi:Tol biopolymer transport system component